MNRYWVAPVVLAVCPLVLVQQMSYGQQDRNRGANVRQWVPFQLKLVAAAHAAKKLKAVFGGSLDIIAVDEDSNTILVEVSPEKLNQVRNFLSRLDVSISTYLWVMPLENVDAANAARMLRPLLQVLALFGDNCDVHVVTTDRNSIIICATEKRINEAQTILRWLEGR